MEAVWSFLDWYLAPWRRISRGGFATALTLVTLPGLFVMIFGWGGSAGHYLSPLLDMMAGGDPLVALNGLMAAGTGAEPAFTVDWTGVMNSLLLLALVPLCRMRLRDMGWYGWQEMVLTAVFNVSVAGGLVECLTGYNPLPWALAWGLPSLPDMHG